ncbi:MAG: dihydrodipicolinate synthase family protein [Syntrophales bacterium LBB04]|nr:dihydrodipicolinate synthase family protein [Syntrophales bacterium LBB04]
MLKGVIPILVTPFHEDESLDLESLDRLIQFMIDLGVDALTVLGVLGESNRLLDMEREQVIAAAIQAAAGRVPVIVGISHLGTSATIGLGKMAAHLGASALMVAPSKDAATDEAGLFQYYRRITAHLDLPLVVQDHPASTQVNMSVGLLLRLVRELPQVAAIKEEAVPSPPRISALRQGMVGSREVPILTGLGALYGMFDLERGSDGFNTGFAFPELLQALVRWHQSRSIL